MGVSAAGFAGALAMSPDSARAAQPTSMLGRDATQYGVRPAVPTIKPKSCSGRSTRPRGRKYRWRCARNLPHRPASPARRHAIDRRARCDKFVFNGGASMLQGEGAGGIGLSVLRSTAAAFRCRRGAG